MRTWLLIMAVIVLSPITALSEGETALRKEWKPDVIDRLYHVTIEEKILNQAIKVDKYRTQWVSTSDSEIEGVWWWKSNAKTNAQRRLMAAEEYLKCLLATTPSDANESKETLIEKEGGNGREANVEVLEIGLALTNLDNIVRLLTMDPNNLESFEKCYICQMTCMTAIVDMYETLVENIDSHYIPAIRDLQRSDENRLKWIKTRMRQRFETDGDRAVLQKSRESDEKFLRLLEKAATIRLPELKKALMERLPSLRENLEMARVLRDQAKDRREVEALMKDFSNNLERARRSPPPLIQFGEE
jgi:hypothetical protein